MSKEQSDKEKFKEAFLKLSKSLIDPDAEPKGEFDLDIVFDEKDTLQFEEEQELDEMFEKGVDEIAEGLIFIDEDEDEE